MNEPRQSDRSRSVDIYSRLLDAIERGTLKPGQRLQEVELSERFGMSRTPIREALKRLQARGIVTHEPYHGAVVTKFDEGRVVELYQVREILEGAAARLAAIHACDTEIELLRDLVARDRANAGDDVADRNRVFHRQIHLAGRNKFLQDELNDLQTSIILLGGTTLRSGERSRTAADEHEAVVNAIGKRDADEAERLARLHIRNSLAVRMELLKD